MILHGVTFPDLYRDLDTPDISCFLSSYSSRSVSIPPLFNIAPVSHRILTVVTSFDLDFLYDSVPPTGLFEGTELLLTFGHILFRVVPPVQCP